MPNLNWETSSVYPLDYVHAINPDRPGLNTFAHNVIADNRATDMMASGQYKPFTTKRLRKEYWDIPQRIGDFHLDYPLADPRGEMQASQIGSASDLDQKAMQYWTKENMDLAFLQHNPLQWSEQRFDIGDRARNLANEFVDRSTVSIPASPRHSSLPRGSG